VIDTPRVPRARLIAFYLPQFHPIPENDRWWGAGFTEWTNVARARPLFPGHWQPRLPGELGFYDLRVPETRAAQAELARAHGIEAFCYWHYWFAGKRLLERPFDDVLASGEPDFPFCLAWANGSWSGVWHGAPERILIEQTYPGPSDDEAHFRRLLPAFGDDRYVTVDGAPLFVVYAPHELPEPRRTTDLWRELALRAGLRGLHLVAVCQNKIAIDPVAGGFDAVTVSNHVKISERWPRSIAEARTRRLCAAYRRLRGRPVHVYAYADAMEEFLIDPPPDVPYHPTIVPGWDNTPRSGIRGVVLRDATPALFARHVGDAVARVGDRDPEHRLVFVKSWNEWAEGNYLEPDERWGRAFLEAVRDAVGTRDAAPVPVRRAVK
jgi:lipopolysaccharide biosynthesis protein